MGTPKKQSKPGFVLQRRDLDLLRGLFECRVMTAAHVAALYFDGREEATKTRLKILKAAGLVKDRAGRRPFEAARLSIAAGGIERLRAEGVLTEYPPLALSALSKRSEVSDLTLGHELAVMDVKVAFHRAARGQPALSVAELGTWPRLYQFEPADASRGPVKPDGFMRIHESDTDGGMSEHCFFLEVDKSTEVLDTLAGKARDYLDHYRTGGFAESQGGLRSEFRDYPFRVLMAFKTAERRNNVAERLLRGTPPILTQVLLSTIEEVRADPLGAIWIRPLDYREATGGTPYAPARKAGKWEYQRQAARESFVKANVKKLPLIDWRTNRETAETENQLPAGG